MRNRDKAKQVAAAAAGAAMAYYGFKKGGAGGAIMAFMGAGLATSRLRSVVGIPARLGGEARHSIEVAASPKEAFDFWARFENLPRFMKYIIDVRETGEQTWRMTVRAPFGKRVVCDVEMIALEPERLIAWRSMTPDVAGRGEIRFEPSPKGARVMAVIEYGLTGGPIVESLTAITGKSPNAMLRADLQRFKNLIEGSDLSQEPLLEGFATV